MQPSADRAPLQRYLGQQVQKSTIIRHHKDYTDPTSPALLRTSLFTMSLKGKVALVTGGGKNLGAGMSSHTTMYRRHDANDGPECARELAREGASLALHYNSPKSKDETVRFSEEITKAYPSIRVSIHAGDLGTAAAVEKLFADVISQHKKIDIVVNTVGMVLKKPITEISEAEYDKMFAYAIFVDEQRRRCVDQFRAESTRRQRSLS